MNCTFNHHYISFEKNIPLCVNISTNKGNIKLGDIMIISIVRTVILYCFIIFAIRLMGKRQISDLQTSELVITFLISDIAAMPMQNTAQPLLSGVTPIAVLIFLEVIISNFMMKNYKFRGIICGYPVLVIDDGKILKSQLKKLRMSTEDLCIQLRQQNIFNLEDVQYCIVETNGKISVLNKPDKRSVNTGDLNIKVPDTGIEAVIISDGEFLPNSLKLCNVDKAWAYQKLNDNKIDLKDVFIMTANREGDYNIIKGDI